MPSRSVFTEIESLRVYSAISVIGWMLVTIPALAYIAFLKAGGC